MVNLNNIKLYPTLKIWENPWYRVSPPAKRDENYDQKGGAGGLPLQKKNKDSEKGGGCRGSPPAKKIKNFQVSKVAHFSTFPPNRKFSAFFNQAETCAKLSNMYPEYV